MVEIETEIGQTAEVEITQGITIGIEAGIEETTEITIGTEVEIGEIAERTVEIEVEVETGLIPEMEEETNQDLDQVKDTLTRINSVTTATEQVIQHTDVSD